MVRLAAEDGADEVVSSLLWDAGTTGIVEIEGQLLAGFEDRAGADAVVELAIGWPAEVVAVEPVTWTGTDEVTTVTIEPDPTQPASPALTLSIVAGPTFGHGGHPTTALAVDLLAGAVRQRLATPPSPSPRPAPSVLDVGTGSGVLAIVAAVLGAGPVVGVDNDPAAMSVAKDNGHRNGVELVVSEAPVDQAPSLVDLASFDVVVANVLAPVQRELAGAMARVLAPGGTLLTTGYLQADGPAITELHRSSIEATGRAPVRVEVTSAIDGWIGHRFDLG